MKDVRQIYELYRSDSLEPPVRVSQNGTVTLRTGKADMEGPNTSNYSDEALGYERLLIACELNSSVANVIWCLLDDHTDLLDSKTSSRRIGRKVNMAQRSVNRAIYGLVESNTLRVIGRSKIDVRYRFDVNLLLDLWQVDTNSSLPLCVLTLCERRVISECGIHSWIEILCKLNYDYPRFAVLSALISAVDIDDQNQPLRTSTRSLSSTAALPVMTVHRSLIALEEQGLIERQDTSSRTACYRLCLEVLRALLAAPLPDVDVLPGITPLPALQRLFPVTPTTGGSQ